MRFLKSSYKDNNSNNIMISYTSEQEQKLFLFLLTNWYLWESIGMSSYVWTQYLNLSIIWLSLYRV